MNIGIYRPPTDIETAELEVQVMFQWVQNNWRLWTSAMEGLRRAQQRLLELRSVDPKNARAVERG